MIQKYKQKKLGKKDRSIILTPLNLCDQWAAEFDKHCPGQFKVLHYWGSNRWNEYTKKDFEDTDIVLSTPQTF